jgi:hypothetical protein
LIPVTLAKSGHVRIELMDDQGRMVANVLDRDLAAGEHLVPVPADGLAPGHYVYRVVTQQGGHVGKLVVLE